MVEAGRWMPKYKYKWLNSDKSGVYAIINIINGKAYDERIAKQIASLKITLESKAKRDKE